MTSSGAPLGTREYTNQLLSLCYPSNHSTRFQGGGGGGGFGGGFDAADMFAQMFGNQGRGGGNPFGFGMPSLDVRVCSILRYSALTSMWDRSLCIYRFKRLCSVPRRLYLLRPMLNAPLAGTQPALSLKV